jgi:hypothetical protein
MIKFTSSARCAAAGRMAIGLQSAAWMASQDNAGLTACQDVIAMLEGELRTANRLRERLERGPITPHDSQEMARLCETLLSHAVDGARAIAMLQDEVCRGAVVSKSRRWRRESSALSTRD